MSSRAWKIPDRQGDRLRGGTMAEGAVARARVLVSGRVQGVCFRAFTRERAGELKLRGWVRNLPDGRVEFVAEGPREAVEALVDWSRRGPPYGRVDDVEVRWEEAKGEPDGFRIGR
jgi:acylphosphatase